jgi:hypothetical protein
MQFFKLPFVAFKDKRLLPNSKLLLCLLLNMADNEHGYCWATNSYLAEQLGVSDRQTRNLLLELRSCDYIECSEDSDKKGDRQIYINANFLDSSAVPQPEKAAPKVAKSAKIKAEKSPKETPKKADECSVESENFELAKNEFCYFYYLLHSKDYAFGAKESAKLKAFLKADKNNLSHFLIALGELKAIIMQSDLYGGDVCMSDIEKIALGSGLFLSPEKTNIYYFLSYFNDIAATLESVSIGIALNNKKVDNEIVLDHSNLQLIRDIAKERLVNSKSLPIHKQAFCEELYPQLYRHIFNVPFQGVNVKWRDIANEPLAIAIFNAIP